MIKTPFPVKRKGSGGNTQKCFCKLYLISVKDWEKLLWPVLLNMSLTHTQVSLHRHQFSTALLGNCVDVPPSTKSRSAVMLIFVKHRFLPTHTELLCRIWETQSIGSEGIFLVLLQCQDSAAVHIFTWVIWVCECTTVCRPESEINQGSGVKMPLKGTYCKRSEYLNVGAKKCPQLKQLLHQIYNDSRQYTLQSDTQTSQLF